MHLILPSCLATHLPGGPRGCYTCLQVYPRQVYPTYFSDRNPYYIDESACASYARFNCISSLMAPQQLCKRATQLA